MRIKRVLQGTALTALAAVAWAGAGTADVAAAENDFPFSNVKFNLSGYAEDEWGEDEDYYDGEYPVDVSMRVTVPKGSREIMVGVASLNKNGAFKIADTAWEVHDVDGDGDEIVNVDLSKLSVTKDNYIAVKSDSTDPVFYRIGASITKLGFDYNAGTNTLTFKDGMKTGANASSLTKDNTRLMYRTSFSAWNYVDCYTWDDTGENYKFDDKNQVFQEYQYQGATVYLRTTGIENDMALPVNRLTDIEDANDKETTKTKYSLYNAGYMPSKEVKLNIAKQANGPSVKADYVNGKVNIPANTQYRVIASGGAISGTKDKPYESTTTKATPTVVELLKLANGENGTATSGTIEVRKAPVTNTKKGKAPSKWTRVAIEVPEKIVITGAKKNNADFELGENTNIEATGGAITLVDKITIEVTSAASGSKKGQVNGVKVTVPSDSKYDVSVDVGAKKPTTVQSGKDKTIKVSAGTTIKIGKAGNARSKAWASETITIGKTK